MANNYTYTVAAGANVLLSIKTRSAAVTVVLPDPPTAGQSVQVADMSLEATTWPITVDAGTQQIGDTGSTTYTIARAGAVLAITYLSGKWKII